MPDAVAFDLQGKHPPLDLWQKMGRRGMLAARIQGGPWLKDLVENCGATLPGGITPDEFDCFHELIAHEEFCRLGVPGYCDGLGAGFVIGIPPVLQFGKPEVAQRVGGGTSMMHMTWLAPTGSKAAASTQNLLNTGFQASPAAKSINSIQCLVLGRV